MQKKIFVALTAAVFVLLASPAHATLLGSGDTSNITSTTTDIPLHLWNLTPSGTKVSFNTSISGSGSSVVKIGSYFFFTDGVGLRKQKAGSTTVDTVVPSSTLDQVTGNSKLVVVSMSSIVDAKKDGSFVYVVSKRVATRFSPLVAEITAADLSTNGKTVAMIAKDAKGKAKLFLSQTSLTKVKAFSLPKNASACSDIAFSPNAKQVALICKFATGTGTVILPIANNQFGAASKKIDQNYTPLEIDWLSENTLVSGGYGALTLQSTFNPEYQAYTVTKGKITKANKLTFDASDIVPSGADLHAPSQLLRISGTKVYYNYVYMGTNPDDATKSILGSAVGVLDVKANTNTILFNDGDLYLFTEAHSLS